MMVEHDPGGKVRIRLDKGTTIQAARAASAEE